jgi:plastocyanin
MITVRTAILAALSLVIALPASAQPAGQVISLSNFSYSPQPIHLRAGRPVTLTFVDRKGSHDFTAKAFFASSTITAGSAPGGKIDLDVGESRSISLIPRAGTYEVHCSHFLHAAMGMTAQIIVD